MTTPLYPLRFEPIFKPAIWGGARLRPFFGHSPIDDPIGEAWLLSDVDGSESRVSNGPLAGRTLRELMAEFGADLLGDAKPVQGRFPLLLKLVDAKRELSVQVHPDDTQARSKDPRATGKTEAWVILEADPMTSRIYSGFQSGMTAERFRAAMAGGTVPDTLHQFTPRPGDCVFLPAGTVHAIGADTLLFEVQQTSDITYRLFDWNRVDAKTGQPRTLHIEDAMACANFASGPCGPIPIRPDGAGERLVDCPYFQLRRITFRQPLTLTIARGGFLLLTAVAGGGTLDGVPIRRGETILLPPSVKGKMLVPEGSVTFLLCRPGAP